MTRTDIHCPSRIQPQDYEFVTVVDIRPDDDPIAAAMLQAEVRENFRRFLKATGATVSNHEHGGTCHICGANAVYMVAWHHIPTNEVILVGYDCTEKLWDGYGKDFAEINGQLVALRKSAARCRSNLAGKAKCQALLADEGLTRAWDLSVAAAADTEVWQDSNLLRVDALRKICDIVRTIIRKGYLSDAQANFLRKLITQHDNAEAVQAERDAVDAARADCPEGRIVVTGKVLTLRGQETAFGHVVKMLVEDESGFKVWGTAPSAIVDDLCDHADSLRRMPVRFDGSFGFGGNNPRVQFTATITRSDDDRKFGFFKRPAKCSILN